MPTIFKWFVFHSSFLFSLSRLLLLSFSFSERQKNAPWLLHRSAFFFRMKINEIKQYTLVCNEHKNWSRCENKFLHIHRRATRRMNKFGQTHFTHKHMREIKCTIYKHELVFNYSWKNNTEQTAIRTTTKPEYDDFVYIGKKRAHQSSSNRWVSAAVVLHVLVYVAVNLVVLVVPL